MDLMYLWLGQVSVKSIVKEFHESEHHPEYCGAFLVICF